MKIKEIRAVSLNLPEIEQKTAPRRPNWDTDQPRGLPMNRYPEFPPTLHPGRQPGIGSSPVWVKVTAEDGTWGLGRAHFGEPVAALIDHHFAPLLEGRDCLAIELLNDMMIRSSLRHGAVGLNASALGGIDIALWDLKGKLLGQPVYRLLNGPVRDRVKCYATSDDLDWSMELGFTAFKISNGVYFDQGIEGINIIEERVAKAREQVGRNAELMINPVMSFDAEFTIRLAERLRPYELRWLEEPLPPTQLDQYEQIRRAVPWMPLATGEDHHLRYSFRDLIDRRLVDVVQPDLHWGGGLSEAVKIHTLAEVAGIKTVPHTGGKTPWGIHFSASMTEVPMAEFWLGTPVGVPLEEGPHLPGCPLPKDGYITLNDAPGFGLEVKEEWIVPWQGKKVAWGVM